MVCLEDKLHMIVVSMGLSLLLSVSKVSAGEVPDFARLMSVDRLDTAAFG